MKVRTPPKTGVETEPVLQPNSEVDADECGEYLGVGGGTDGRYTIYDLDNLQEPTLGSDGDYVDRLDMLDDTSEEPSASKYRRNCCKWLKNTCCWFLMCFGAKKRDPSSERVGKK
jgi:hypothetical protein